MVRRLYLVHWAVLGFIALILGVGSAGTARAAAPHLAATSCAACHGMDGNSTDPHNPKLAGQKAGYLAQQLQAFRSGQRPSPIMAAFAQGLSDAEIGDLARYYSAQRTTTEKTPDATGARRGAAIFRSACASCHAAGTSRRGMMGSGMMGGAMMGGGMMMRTRPELTPTLFGQHAPYLERQLDAYARGARHNPDMATLAARLSSADRKAVADYLAGAR